MEKFSVLMSVYKSEKPSYLDVALESVCENQSVLPTEVVLVKDGPLSNKLDQIIDKWGNRFPRLVLLEKEVNEGLASALNDGINLCSFELVFRMDTDDISMPNRFEKQLEFMRSNPGVDVCGSYIQEFEESPEDIVSERTVPQSHDEIIKFSRSRNPLSHPSVCFRKEAVLLAGSYPIVYPEDYLLWIKMIQNGSEMANIRESLVKMRVGSDFIKRRGWTFLKGELEIYLYMYRTSYISLFELIFNVVGRSVVRLAPEFVKLWLYKKARK